MQSGSHCQHILQVWLHSCSLCVDSVHNIMLLRRLE